MGYCFSRVSPLAFFRVLSAPRQHLKAIFGPLSVASLCMLTACSNPERAIEDSLRSHVLFFSNFEKGVDALDSEGNPLATFDTANTQHVKTGGALDGYLAFNKQAGALNYSAEKNFPYSPNHAWSGSVAFWMRVDTSELEADYPEPFHIGKRDERGYPWDDATLFIDIKKPDMTLRFGCYPDKTQEITDQMVADRVITTPLNWKPTEWRHIAITWSNFNSRKADAEWALFVDGVEVGRKGPLRQNMTWNISDIAFRFNHYRFPGHIDEIAVFDKKLTADEVAYLITPKKPLNELFYKKSERR